MQKLRAAKTLKMFVIAYIVVLGAMGPELVTHSYGLDGEICLM